ncbi:MAG: S8 family serine peptidase [Luteibaculaceae bacterium]
MIKLYNSFVRPCASLFFLFILITSPLSEGLNAQVFVSETLTNFSESARNTDKTRVFIHLEDKVNLWEMRANFKANQVPQKERAKQVLLALRAKSSSSQTALLTQLAEQFEQGKDFSINQQFWVVNALEINATKAVLAYLAEMQGIAQLVHPEDEKFVLMHPVEETHLPESVSRDAGNTEQGLIAIGAPALWAMGYTGHNTILYCIDTGVWEEHPAIGSRFLANHRPLSQVWFGYDSEVPVDKSGNHGTHVIGTVLGLERETNDTIGVAFGARFIASDPVATSAETAKDLSENVIGFQWALDPDDDPETTDDMPDVINNSWGKPQTGPAVDINPCYNSPIADVLDAIFVAGIGNIISAGNSGPGPMTLGQPANYAAHPLNMFSVGAVNGNSTTFPIANFSSRGPSYCILENNFAVADSVKPEVVAPGVSVRSADGPTGYGLKSGTSMAAPHVSGLFLLLKEAFPDLSGEDIMEAMYFSATDLGEPGPDNTFGRGMINGLAAYNYLAENNTPTPPLERTFDPYVTVSGSDNLFQCLGTLDSPTVTFHNHWNLAHTEAQGASLSFYLNGNLLSTQNLTNTVEPFSEESFTFNLEPHLAFVLPGRNEFSVVYERTATEPQDFDRFNNTFFWRFTTKEQTEVPFLETFENFNEFPVGKWTVNNPDNARTWVIRESAGLENSEQSAFINLAQYTPRASQLDDLITPEIELSTLQNHLSFDLCYANRNLNLRTDTLRIFISNTCGNSWTEVYKKGGATLNTVPQASSNFIPSQPEHWKKEFLDLSNWEGNILVKFQSENRLGNNLLIDNVAVNSGPVPVGINEFALNGNFKVFPNPTKKIVSISWENQQAPKTYELINMVGKKLETGIITGSDNMLQLSLEKYPESLYVIRLCDTVGNCTILKVVKQ